MFASLLGNTRSVGSDKGYYGYDQDTTGVVIGGAYDNGYLSSIGGYFGYTKADTEFDKAKASSESEGIHLGVIGRYSPEGNADPSFSFYGDAGYSHYTVDTRRRVGGNVQGYFKQNAFTAGLGTA